jgi:micrococcal nuclease
MRLPKKRTIRRLYLLVSLVIAVYIALAQTGAVKMPKQAVEQKQPGLYAINHFVDGDTISVNMGGSVETVRMIGVDTPETHRPNTPVQCYGPEAAAYTKQLIGSNRVRLQADQLDTNRDRYDRLLRYVYLPDGTLLQAKLIQEGYAFAYTGFPFEKKNEFISYEQQAKAAKKGLWATCQVTVESTGREQTNAAQ